MPNSITASPTYYGHQLSNDDRFIQKVQQVIVNYALVVMAEALNVANHSVRVTLAKSILGGNSLNHARIIAPIVVNHANLSSTITIIDGVVNNTANDAQLLAAITAQWNMYAGIESGT